VPQPTHDPLERSQAWTGAMIFLNIKILYTKKTYDFLFAEQKIPYYKEKQKENEENNCERD
jgi:hypothetical protein